MKAATEMILEGYGVEDLRRDGHSYAAISNAADSLLASGAITEEHWRKLQSIINRYRKSA